ncbi:MAG TPA: hypothetical protein VI299_20745 [Polyangiales bacterium]
MLALARPALAQEPDPHGVGLESPYAPSVRSYYYAQLAKDPWRALGAELLVPGAGNFYVGLYVPAAITLALSCVGASLWIAGAVRDRDATMWAGVGTFAGARLYGAISAPTSAVLLNSAFRRQFGVRE